MNIGNEIEEGHIELTTDQEPVPSEIIPEQTEVPVEEMEEVPV